jgi:hypothetical protein
VLAQSLTDIGHKSTYADPDAWIRAAFKPDRFECCKMVLVHVDDVLHLSHDVKPTMDALRRLHELKPELCGPPTRHLGANVGECQFEDGRMSWSMSAHDCVKNAAKNVEEEMLRENHEGLKSKADRPHPQGHRTETDVTPELSDELANRCQQLIGVLRWVGVACSHAKAGSPGGCVPCFRLLEATSEFDVGVDERLPHVKESAFLQVDWGGFYGTKKEEMPPKMLTARGNLVRIFCFADTDHAGNIVTRRSHTGVLAFVNNTLVSWFSKRQNTVECSTFGSEFVVLQIVVEQLEALRCKLRMQQTLIAVEPDQSNATRSTPCAVTRALSASPTSSHHVTRVRTASSGNRHHVILRDRLPSSLE